MATSLRRVLAVTRLNVVLLGGDPASMLAYVAMPIVLMFFLAPVDRLSARSPFAGRSQAVAGMAVMFAIFMINVMGTAFFSEHGWRTWDRLRATPSVGLELLVGKALPLLVVLAAQSAVVFTVGFASLGVGLPAAPWALFVVDSAYLLTVFAFGLCLIGLARTRGQMGALADAAGILFACVGGALIPAAALPHWASYAVPFVPSHWAMRGINAAIAGRGFHTAGESTAVLLGFAAAYFVIAAALYRRFQQRSLQI